MGKFYAWGRTLYWKAWAWNKVWKFERRRRIPGLFLDFGMLRRGFNSEQRALYDFRNHRYSDYMNDVQRMSTISIVGHKRILLGDKVLFERNFGWAMPVVRNLAVARRGRVRGLAGSWLPGSDLGVAQLLGESPSGIVAKPAGTGGGVGIVLILPDAEGSVRWNSEVVTFAEADRRLGELAAQADHVITEFIVQSAFARSLSPETVNTVRAVTCWEPSGAFLLRAVMRIGTQSSKPVDNFSKGGLSAMIDPATGELTRAATFPKDGKLIWRESHPDSGARIQGAAIPRWNELRDRLLRMASLFPETAYVAWDLILTDDENGFRVLEGNNAGDVNLHQIHGPLLADPRARAFFARHRIVGAKNRSKSA